MADQNFLLGFLLGRRTLRPWRGRARTRPKMPSARWRWSAFVVTSVGALLGAALAMSLDWAPVRWAVIGAIAGFVIGMYIAETVYERQVAAQRPERV